MEKLRNEDQRQKETLELKKKTIVAFRSDQ